MPQELRPRKAVPAYEGTLRNHMIMIPPCISECSGIRVFGRRIKSLAFTTDVAIIRTSTPTPSSPSTPSPPSPPSTGPSCRRRTCLCSPEWGAASPGG